MMYRIMAILVSFFLLGTSFPAHAGEIPHIDTAAPEFTLPDQAGNPVTLPRFHGKWVVLYFYPKDSTHGCSIEAHNFQADLEKYTQKNAVIMGVSLDTVDSHKDFSKKTGLDFMLLSDSAHTVTETYGSLNNVLGVSLAARNTFLIDPAGIIRKIYLNVSPPTHSTEVLS